MPHSKYGGVATFQKVVILVVDTFVKYKYLRHIFTDISEPIGEISLLGLVHTSAFHHTVLAARNSCDDCAHKVPIQVNVNVTWQEPHIVQKLVQYPCSSNHHMFAPYSPLKSLQGLGAIAPQTVLP